MRTPTASLPVGVVLRRAPGVTRWAKWSWKPVAVLPGAGPADWVEMRREGETVEYHMGTSDMQLWRGEAQSYRDALADKVPSVFVILRAAPNNPPEKPWELMMVTACPYEAQDYMEGGDELVEKVPMPSGLIAYLRAFVDEHFAEEPFIKRKRDKARVDRHDDGRGDARIRQEGDVYRAPRRKGPLH